MNTCVIIFYKYFVEDIVSIIVILGQNKKKNKKDVEQQETPFLFTSIAPDFEYYQGKKICYFTFPEFFSLIPRFGSVIYWTSIN